MNLKFLASFLLMCAVILYATKRSNKIQENIEKKFWDKEHRANSVRKKSLDSLNYITVPDEILHMQPVCMTEEIQSYLQDLNDLAKLPIVNLTGISNTDLKLAYGTANITILSEYDSHYTNLVTTLQKLAELLVKNEEKALAESILEFAVSTGTDVSKSYYLLSSLYQDEGKTDKINHLIKQASQINSIMRDSIVHNLEKARDQLAS